MQYLSAELEDFTAAVIQRSTPTVGGYDGLQSLYIALAAAKSAKENRPVTLAEVEGEL